MQKRVPKNEILLSIIGGSIAYLMEWIEENFGCFFKSDPMLLHIDVGFILIPLKFEALQSVYDIHETMPHTS